MASLSRPSPCTCATRTSRGSWGLCPSAALGFWCPGCGGLRAVNDLTDLRLADAASSNLLLVVAMPVVVLLLGRWLLDAWTGRVRAPLAAPHPTAALLVLASSPWSASRCCATCPAGSWLAP